MFLNRRISVLLAFCLTTLVFTGCKSKFEKLRNSNNITMKYQEAVKLYEKGKYAKARILFDDLASKYRGRAEAEDLFYLLANTHYKLKDYTAARYDFKNFANTYPNSERAEECRYMAAYCYFLESPRFSLDQENTRKAIDELQLFINYYPESERAEKASELVQILRDKLERKAFENAKLYYNMGLADDYRAAVIALENVLRQYPDTKYAEAIEFLIFKSQYLYADNSRVYRQEERFNTAIDYYNSFIEHFPNSKFRSEADDLKKSADKKIVAAIRLMEQYNKEMEERNKELGIAEEAKAAEAETK